MPLVLNVALGRPTEQSTTSTGGYLPRVSANAVDGCSLTDFNHGCCTHTEREDQPWLAVDLEKHFNIAIVKVVNRDGLSGEAFVNYILNHNLTVFL